MSTIAAVAASAGAAAAAAAATTTGVLAAAAAGPSAGATTSASATATGIVAAAAAAAAGPLAGATTSASATATAMSVRVPVEISIEDSPFFFSGCLNISLRRGTGFPVPDAPRVCAVAVCACGSASTRRFLGLSRRGDGGTRSLVGIGAEG